ncbi:MAG: DnaB-like helicase N-terminal domain-containing protein [Intestinibacter sp.]|uniref:DnaB-like helicase N-terminal domain-containing protein n=1 Tax=Intestinibacter sp. TaxID=1965304 RepID=UPI003F1523A7
MNDLFNVEAEQSILGAILLDSNAIYEGKEINLSTHDFYINAHRIIYSCMKKLSNDNVEIDLITLTDELRNVDMLDKIGGIPYITSLSTIVPTTSNILYYMRIVKDLSVKRDVYKLFQDTQKDLKKLKSDDLIKFSDDLKSMLLDTSKVEDLFVDASTIARTTDHIGGIPTGFNYLDSVCGGGLTYGSLTVLTGEPGSGKSTILNQVMANAMSKGYKSFIYSGELTYQMLMSWFTKTVANKEHLVRCTSSFGEYMEVSKEGWDLISNWTKDKLFIYSKDAKANECNLTNVIEYLAVKKNVKLFVLDNLMTIECRGSDKYEKQIKIVTAFKDLAKKYNLAIVLVAHPNKSSAINKDPSMFEISGASEIPNLADYVFKTVRGEDEKNSLLVLKNRITGIQKKDIRLKFDYIRKRFVSTANTELKQDYGYEPKYEQVEIGDMDPFLGDE